MVKINRVYTCAGDDGQRASDGARLPKFRIRVAVIDSVDEANGFSAGLHVTSAIPYGTC